MAMAQAMLVRSEILALDASLTVTFAPITTRADLWHGDLSTIGGKGLFTRQIDQMLMEGQVDVAVHCMKDVPGDEALPEGLRFVAILKRDDVRDVLITVPKLGPTLTGLPPNTRVGTSSVRRRAQLLGLRADLDISPLRGTLGTRLQRLGADGGESPDAIIVAAAGLVRLNLLERASSYFDTQEVLPAVGAGALGVMCRRDDPLQELITELDHLQTRREVGAERAMLFGLQGHCNSPIAGFCHSAPDGRLELTGRVFSSDGRTAIESRSSAHPDEAFALGTKVSDDLLAQGARELIDVPDTAQTK
jgi:hydroxymethylbilane synthase